MTLAASPPTAASRATWACLALLALDACSASPDRAADAASATDTTSATDATLPELAASAEVQLGASFTIQHGRFAFLQGVDCAKAGNCYGNNPSSPYGLLLVPPAPGRPLPPEPIITTDAGGAQCYGQAGCAPALTGSFMLAADEVVVATGFTPPEVAYWGMTSYVYSRVRDGARDPVFASLGDSTNLATWRSPTGSSFEAPFVVLLGANPATLATAQAAFTAAGVDSRAILTLTIPGGTDTSAFTFGDDPAAAIELTFLLRSAVPRDEAAFAAYIDPVAVARRFSVLRLTPLTPVGAAPQPWPSERTRGSGDGEGTALRDGLDQLARAVKKVALDDGMPVELASALTWAAVGEPIYEGGKYCYDNAKDCLGDSPDALYSITTTAMPLAADGSTYDVAIGVNHSATGKAAYTNVSVTEISPPTLAAATAADASFGGSAAYYFAQAGIAIDPAVAAQLYAIRFSWHCGGASYCVDLTEAAMAAGVWSGDPPTESWSLSPDDPLNVTERAYLDLITGTGPSHDQLISPRVIYVH